MLQSTVKFRKLRQEMRSRGISQLDLCEMWNEDHPNSIRYQSQLSCMMCGYRPFPLDFAYFALDVLGVPHDQLHIYFPSGGEDDAE